MTHGHDNSLNTTAICRANTKQPNEQIKLKLCFEADLLLLRVMAMKVEEKSENG